MKRPIALYFLLLTLIIVSTGALSAGAMLIMRPDGSLLGMQPEWLEHSPFKNYLLPGIILFLFNGVFPFITLAGLIQKPVLRFPEKINLYPGRHWAWAWSLYSGIILIIWITVQLILTQYFWLQPVMIFAGLCIIICTLTPGVIRYYETGQQVSY